MKPKPLSDTQKKALDMAVAAGGRLERWPGGYWTTESYQGKKSVIPPKRWIGTQTIAALVNRGCLEVSARTCGGAWLAVRYVAGVNAKANVQQ